MIRILLLDDHRMVGEGTKNMIEAHSDFQVIYVSDADTAMQMSQKEPFDLYLLDMNVSETVSGLKVAQKIRNRDPDAKVIIYTGFDYINRFDLIVSSGIGAVISKDGSAEELMLTIRAVLSGYAVVPLTVMKRLRLKEDDNLDSEEQEIFYELTEKEIQLLAGIADGQKTSQLADQFFTSNRTIEYWVSKLFKKMNVNSRSEAVSEAIRRGLIDP